MTAAVILTAKTAPKAERKVQAKEKELGRRLSEVEQIKLVAKDYVPVVGFVVAGAGMIFYGNQALTKRNAALYTFYAAAEGKLLAWQKTTFETIGAKKYHELEDIVDLPREKLSEEMRTTDKTLFFDSYTGRLFLLNNYQEIHRINNDLNRLLLDEGYVTLNDFYHAVHLTPMEYGEEIGFVSDQGLIEFQLDAVLVEERPAIRTRFSIKPRSFE
jgi:hypothetical protein